VTLPAPDPSLPDLPVTFRPRRARLVAYTVAGLTVAVLVVVAGLLPATGGVRYALADRVGLVLLAVPVVGVLHLLARPRVVAREQGLLVVNMLRRRWLEWPEIVEVNLREGDPWVSLDLADGDTLAVMALQAADGRRGRDQAVLLRRFVQQRSQTERDD